MRIVAFDDEKGATRLIKKVIKAGVEFKEEHFAESLFIVHQKLWEKH